MKKKVQKYYKTIIQVEVLSDEPYVLNSLEDVDYDITEGHCSGIVFMKSQTEMTEKQIARALKKQGSDPSFLIMGD